MRTKRAPLSTWVASQDFMVTNLAERIRGGSSDVSGQEVIDAIAISELAPAGTRLRHQTAILSRRQRGPGMNYEDFAGNPRFNHRNGFQGGSAHQVGLET